MTDADDVVACARRRAQALADADEAQLRALLHPDFAWISHRGQWFDLEGYVAANAGSPIRWHRQELHDPEVRVVGDTAVLRCRVTDTVDLGAGPEPFVMPMTQTWVRTLDGWQCLAGHAGPRLPS